MSSPSHVQRAPIASSVTRAVIYCRVSTDGQEGNSSLATQEARCSAHANERGWEVVNIYREIHTGSELFERPQLSRLREELRSGLAEVVLAYALDRMSRNQAHLGFLLSEWDHLGVRLELVTEAFDETPEGRLLQSVRGFVAEMERLKISERTTRGRRSRVESGKLLPGCRVLFGYAWRNADRAALTEDPVTGPIVRRIFQSAAAGISIRRIASALTTEGVRTPTGKDRWRASTIWTILANSSYAGEARALRTRHERLKGGKVRNSTRPVEEQVALPTGTIPSLVDPATYAAVRARLDRNKAEATRNNSNPEAALLRSGFVRCGYCGTICSVHNGPAGARYRCAGPSRSAYGCPCYTMQADLLDTAVWDRLTAVLTRPDIVAQEVERLRTNDPAALNLEALDRRLADITRRQERIGRAVATLDDEDAAAPLLGELKALAAQQRDLQGERADLELQRVVWRQTQDRITDVGLWCRRVADNLPALSYAEKRDLVAALGVKVQLWSTDHTPRWELTMTLGDVVTGTS